MLLYLLLGPRRVIGSKARNVRTRGRQRSEGNYKARVMNFHLLLLNSRDQFFVADVVQFGLVR